MNDDWESKFDEIVQGLDLGDFSDPRDEDLSSWEIARALAGLNEVATYLARHIMQQSIDADIGDETMLPPRATPHMRALIDLTNLIAEILCECDCVECRIEACEDCAEEGFMCAEHRDEFDSIHNDDEWPF